MPSDEAVTIALRTQQILAEESGVTHTVDPLGGSYFVEATDRPCRARRAGVHPPHRRDGRDDRPRSSRFSAEARSPTPPITTNVKVMTEPRRSSASTSTRWTTQPARRFSRSSEPRSSSSSWSDSRSCAQSATTSAWRPVSRRCARAAGDGREPDSADAGRGAGLCHRRRGLPGADPGLRNVYREASVL